MTKATFLYSSIFGAILLFACGTHKSEENQNTLKGVGLFFCAINDVTQVKQDSYWASRGVGGAGCIAKSGAWFKAGRWLSNDKIINKCANYRTEANCQASCDRLKNKFNSKSETKSQKSKIGDEREWIRSAICGPKPE